MYSVFIIYFYDVTSQPITVEFKGEAWGYRNHSMPLFHAPCLCKKNSEHWSVKDCMPKATGQFSPVCESISVWKSYHVVRSLLRTQDTDEIEPKAISQLAKYMWILLLFFLDLEIQSQYIVFLLFLKWRFCFLVIKMKTDANNTQGHLVIFSYLAFLMIGQYIERNF